MHRRSVVPADILDGIKGGVVCVSQPEVVPDLEAPGAGKALQQAMLAALDKVARHRGALLLLDNLDTSTWVPC